MSNQKDYLEKAFIPLNFQLLYVGLKPLQKVSLLLFFVLSFQPLFSQYAGVGRDVKGYYILNSKGSKLSEAYELIQPGEDLHLVYKGGKFGYLNSTGKEIIPCEYDIAYEFNGKFALVGKSNKYYYINIRNQRLDSLTRPIAPYVYNTNYLVHERKVYGEDGTALLNSNNKLIFAAKAGIIEWNPEDSSAVHYVSVNGEKSLKKTRQLSVVSEPISTIQGYIVFPLREKGKVQFAVYGESGECYVQTDAKDCEPQLITLVWDQYVYVPKANEFPVATFTMMGQQTLFPMRDLWMKGAGVKSPFNYYLSNLHASSKIVQLYPDRKWAVFNDGKLSGSYLFDELLPGDEDKLPARIGEKWYIYDWVRDSLTFLPYNHVHPVGMNKGRLFVSSALDFSLNEQHWAMVSRGKMVTKEIYAIPLLPYQEIIFDHLERYKWGEKLTEVMLDNKRILLDYAGREIWQDSEGQVLKPADLCKVAFRFKYGKFAAIGRNQNFPKNQCSVNLSSGGSGLVVKLVNTTDKPFFVLRQDDYISATLERKDAEGRWVAIGYLTPSDCGNSYFSGEIPSGTMTSSSIVLPEGTSPVVVRVVVKLPNEMEQLESNEITVYTNGALSWVDRYCGGYGCDEKLRPYILMK